MKSLYTLALACLVVGGGLFGVAIAHETVKGGTATMFVHIDPTEPAVVGIPATLFINLTNTEKGFLIGNCNCTLTIKHDKKILLAVPLVASVDPDTFGIEGVPVTFMTSGDYDITVHGEPATPGLFAPFDVDYDTDVLAVGMSGTSSEHTHHSPLLHDLHLLVLFGGIGASTVVIYRERKELFGKK